MGRGAAGPENLPAELQGRYSGRKERLRANPQTMDRDTNRRCRLTRHKRRRKSPIRIHPHRPGPGGSAPRGTLWVPRDLSPGCQSRRTKTETGRTSAPRLRSWPLTRRSGRVSAWPCPPVRLPTILSAAPAPNHCRCAQLLPRTAAGCRRRSPVTQSTHHPSSVSERTYSESHRQLRTRYTRSWAVVFSAATHFWTNDARNVNSRHIDRFPLVRACRDRQSLPFTKNIPALSLDTTDSFREGHPS